MKNNALLKILAAILIAAYPILVYFGLAHFGIKFIALALILIVGLRFFIDKTWSKAASLLMIVLLAGGSLYFNNEIFLKLYPVLVNSIFLLVFLASLISPPSAIERIARLTDKTFSDTAIAYTRNVTWIWCVFFIVNGCIALYTALYATQAQWALYNGFICYLFMGILFGGEWIFRHFYRKNISL